MITVRSCGGYHVVHGNVVVGWRTYEVVIVWRGRPIMTVAVLWRKVRGQLDYLVGA